RAGVPEAFAVLVGPQPAQGPLGGGTECRVVQPKQDVCDEARGVAVASVARSAAVLPLPVSELLQAEAAVGALDVKHFRCHPRLLLSLQQVLLEGGGPQKAQPAVQIDRVRNPPAQVGPEK